MASLSINIIPSRKNDDGTHTIRVVLSHKHRTVYIPTPFKVNSTKEWKNGMVVGVPDANIINRKLRNLLNIYQDRLDKLPTSRMTCTQIRDLITEKKTTKESIKEHIDFLVQKYVSEGRKMASKTFRFMSKHLFELIPEDAPFEILNIHLIEKFEKLLYSKGVNNTTANIYLAFLRIAINSAIDAGVVSYDVHPFAKFKMPEPNVRDICLTKEELAALREYESKRKPLMFAKDMFFLSFYLGGINYVDLQNADITGDTISFVRRKTASKKMGEKVTSITIQPEAKEIIDRYGPVLKKKLATSYGTINITQRLREIGKELGFPKPLMYYSARKTFVQFGFELDIPLYIMEYAIGHSIKEAANRPIFNYIVVMREKADRAIRRIIDYTKE